MWISKELAIQVVPLYLININPDGVSILYKYPLYGINFLCSLRYLVDVDNNSEDTYKLKKSLNLFITLQLPILDVQASSCIRLTVYKFLDITLLWS